MKRVTPIRDWREMRALDTAGRIDPRSPANMLLVLREHPVFKNSFAWNDMTGEIELTRAIAGVGEVGDYLDPARFQLLTVYLEQHEGLRTNIRDLDISVFVVAKENRFNALQQQLVALRWDGQERLKTWLATYLGAAGAGPRIAVAGSRLLLSAVARIFSPGCGLDALWMFQAPFGEAMHEAMAILFGKYYNRFADPQGFSSVGTCVEHVRGSWCLNVMDGHSWRPLSALRIKTMARRMRDPTPPQYLKYTHDTYRTTIYVSIIPEFPNDKWFATVNAADPFFERVACVRRPDLAALKRDRNQLFAETVALYQTGKSWLREAWREPDKPDPEREKVAAYCSGKYQVSMEEVVVEALGKSYDPTNRGMNKGVGMMLASIGLRRVNVSKFGTPSSYRYRWVK